MSTAERDGGEKTGVGKTGVEKIGSEKASIVAEEGVRDGTGRTVRLALAGAGAAVAALVVAMIATGAATPGSSPGSPTRARSPGGDCPWPSW
nr:hypothetical protein GCM10020093_110780 [Planobispora longispora]